MNQLTDPFQDATACDVDGSFRNLQFRRHFGNRFGLDRSPPKGHPIQFTGSPANLAGSPAKQLLSTLLVELLSGLLFDRGFVELPT